MLWVTVVAAFFAIVTCDAPEQVHLAYGMTEAEMRVMWVTGNKSDTTVVYGTSSGHLTQHTTGTSHQYTGVNNPKGKSWYHDCLLTGLKPLTAYYYRVVSNGVSSDEYHFNTRSDDPSWSPKVILFGDMGRHGGAPTLVPLRREVKNGWPDFMIHNGDFAYDLMSDGGVNGDEFMNRIQDGIASLVPYMTSVGNHEIAGNFTQYANRFHMPNATRSRSMWWSMDVGRAHLVFYSTEAYFTSKKDQADQLAWLKDDLRRANEPKQRAERPWIITFGHRPMYCSNLDNDCLPHVPVYNAELEPLFHAQGVDVMMEAHEHSYERTWPVYQGKVCEKGYVNPTCMVHLVAGAAGCNESDGWCLNPMLGPKGPWSAKRYWFPGTWGYGRLEFHNATHMTWEQMDDLTGDALDTLTLVVNHHGPRHV